MVESGDSPDVTLDKSLDPHFRTMITGFLSTAARCTQGFFRRQGRRALNAKDVQFPFLSFLAYVIFRDGSLVPLRPNPLLFSSSFFFRFNYSIRSECSIRQLQEGVPWETWSSEIWRFFFVFRIVASDKHCQLLYYATFPPNTSMQITYLRIKDGWPSDTMHMRLNSAQTPKMRRIHISTKTRMGCIPWMMFVEAGVTASFLCFVEEEVDQFKIKAAFGPERNLRRDDAWRLHTITGSFCSFCRTCYFRALLSLSCLAVTHFYHYDK